MNATLFLVATSGIHSADHFRREKCWLHGLPSEEKRCVGRAPCSVIARWNQVVARAAEELSGTERDEADLRSVQVGEQDEDNTFW